MRAPLLVAMLTLSSCSIERGGALAPTGSPDGDDPARSCDPIGDGAPPETEVEGASELVWVVNSADRVFAASPRPARAATTILLHAARGEYEAAQIAIRSPAALSGVHVQHGALINPCGATIAASEISVRREYNHPRVEVPPGDLEAAPDGAEARHDALVENTPGPLAAGVTGAYFYQVHVPPGQQPGTYTGTAVVSSSAGDVTVPVRVVVYPVTLPPTDESVLKMNNWHSSAGWDYTGTINAIPLQYDVAMFDEDWWTVIGNMARNLARHRNNVVYADFQALLIPDTTINPDGSFALGWDTFDRFVQTFIDAGAAQYIYTPTLIEPPLAHVEILRATGDGRVERVLVEHDSAEANAYFDVVFPALRAHLDAKGWTDIFYMSAVDEPRTPAEAAASAWLYTKYRQTFDDALTNEAHYALFTPNEPHLTTVTPMVNAYAANLGHYQALRLDGKELWLYYCGYVLQNGELGRMLRYHLARSRMTPWMVWKIGGTGFLHWGWNYWYAREGSLDTFDGLHNGDDYLVRPNKAALDVYDSLRSEALTDGQEDFELLVQLAERKPVLAHSLGASLIQGIQTYSYSGADLDARHRQLLEALADPDPEDAAFPYADDFSAGADAWRHARGSWSIAGGAYAQTDTSSWQAAAAALEGRAYGDVAASVDVRITGVTAEGGDTNWAGLVVRNQNGTEMETGYLVALRNNGQVFVNRTGATLGAAQVPGYAAGQTVRLRVVARGTTLSVYAGGTPLLTVEDDAYPVGELALITGGASARFDNVRVNPMTNPAEGARVTVSSAYDGDGWSARAATDGQTASAGASLGWSSAGATSAAHAEWISLDLGAVRPVSRVDLHPRDDGANAGMGFPVDFTIQVSKDGVTWTEVASRTGFPRPSTAQAFAFAATEARHVKVLATRLAADPHGLYRLQLAEVEVAGGNLAAGRAVTASSAHSSPADGWLPRYATDGNPRSQPGHSLGWSSAVGDADRPEWIAVDLGAETHVSRVVLVPRTDGRASGHGWPAALELAVSLDGLSWTNVAAEAVDRGLTPGTVFAFEPTTARHVRVTGTSLGREPNGGLAMQLAELEVR